MQEDSSPLKKYTIIIPAHNEEKFIKTTLDCIISQTIEPYEVVVVNDHSTDRTKTIVEKYVEKYNFIKLIDILSKNEHQPGSKVIQAFLEGYKVIDPNYDIIVKLDADLDIPKNYFEVILNHFNRNRKIAMVGGFAYIEREGKWVLENLTDKTHIRGAFKAYRKSCYEKIGGLRPHMGWDTVDELLCKYYGWQVVTDESLKIKHLKPTGANYNKSALFKQGTAYYSMGYSFWITLIAGTKLAIRKNKLLYIVYYLKGYFTAYFNNEPKMVNRNQQRFIRKYRWSKIKQKLKGL